MSASVRNDAEYAIGQRIRAARNRKGWSQTEMGSQLRLTHSAISQIERGHTRLTIALLDRVARLLDTSVDDLLGAQVSGAEPAPHDHHWMAGGFYPGDKTAGGVPIAGAYQVLVCHCGDVRLILLDAAPCFSFVNGTAVAP